MLVLVQRVQCACDVCVWTMCGYWIRNYMRNMCDAIAREGKKKQKNQQTKCIIHLICISYTIYYTFAVSFSHSCLHLYQYIRIKLKHRAVGDFDKLINRKLRHSFILSISLTESRQSIAITTVLIRVSGINCPVSGLKGGNDLVR